MSRMLKCECYCPGVGTEPMELDEFREELLDAVEALLMRKGIGKVTLEDSGENAGDIAGTRYIFTPLAGLREKREERDKRIREASCYYKAVFGRRPHCHSDSDYLAAWQAASDEMKRRKSTPEGRNQLREEGWVLADDPPMAVHYRE